MKNLQGSFRRNPGFFIGYLLFFFVLLAFCLLTGKTAGFLYINSFHNRISDDFFILITNIGNGLFIIIIIAWMLIRRKKVWAWQTGISFLTSGLIVQIGKHAIYSPRPSAFFQSKASIHLLQGITCTGNSSFPSGHTASVFALATLLSLYSSDKRWGILYLSIAFLAGFSRIYLSQHFPVDVLVGSAIGVLVSVFIYCLLPSGIFEKKSAGSSWMFQSIKLH
jgi:membrane-associated phospholipid phosphatase